MTGWWWTSPSSSGSGRPKPPRPTGTGRWCCAARWTGRACGCRWCRCPPRPSDWAGWPGSWRRCPGRASCTRSPSQRPRRWPSSCASAGTRWPPTPAGRSRRSGWPPRPTCWPTGSRRWSPRARWEWASTSPISGSSCTSARRPPRWPTTSRSGAPAGPSIGRRWCCCPAARTATSGPTSRRWPSRRSHWCGRPCGCSRRPETSRCRRQRIETRVDLSRTRLEMLLKVLDADGAVRRVRGGWVGTGAEWVYDEQRHRRIAEARRAEQQAMLDYIGHHRVPAGLPAPPARRSRHRRGRPLRAL